MSAAGFWAADAVALNMQLHNERKRAGADLVAAERYHCGTLAQLATCLAEIERLEPGNPLLVGAVRNRIDAAGEDSYRRTNGFQAAWKLNIDPRAVLAQIQAEHEAKRTQVLEVIKADHIPIIEKGLFTKKLVYRFAGTDYADGDFAVAVKREAVRLAQAAGLGDSLDLRALVKAAEASLKRQ